MAELMRATARAALQHKIDHIRAVTGPNTGGFVTVHQNVLMQHATGGYPRFTALASDLGWAPGKWPRIVRLEPNIGNEQPFTLEALDDAGAVYLQGNGTLKLTVFND